MVSLAVPVRSGETPTTLRRRRRNRATVDRIALYLHEKGVGHEFAATDLIQHVQDETGITYTEIDRRLRSLRAVNWVIHSNLNDPSLGRGRYRLVKIGDHVWHKNYRWPSGRSTCPAPIRRAVLERDKRCVLCGIEPGQPYPDQPERLARLTIGRLLAGSRGGEYSLENCRTECTRCNCDARDNYDDSALEAA